MFKITAILTALTLSTFCQASESSHVKGPDYPQEIHNAMYHAKEQCKQSCPFHHCIDSCTDVCMKHLPWLIWSMHYTRTGFRKIVHAIDTTNISHTPTPTFKKMK